MGWRPRGRCTRASRGSRRSSVRAAGSARTWLQPRAVDSARPAQRSPLHHSLRPSVFSRSHAQRPPSRLAPSRLGMRQVLAGQCRRPRRAVLQTRHGSSLVAYSLIRQMRTAQARRNGPSSGLQRRRTRNNARSAAHTPAHAHTRRPMVGAGRVDHAQAVRRGRPAARQAVADLHVHRRG
jgi:hypothetical protein